MTGALTRTRRERAVGAPRRTRAAGEPVVRRGAHRDAHARRAVRPGPDIEEALERAGRKDEGFTLLLRHARRGGAHRRGRPALFRKLHRGDARDGRPRHHRASPRAGLSVKLSALHPRYETRTPDACAELTACCASSPMMPALRHRPDGRRRGIRSPEVAPRHHRGRRAPAELCGWDGLGMAVQGYRQARPRRRRLGRSSWAPKRAAPDRPPGQGRLLGQRDQARAGGRPAGLSRCSPARRNRCRLSRLRPRAAEGAQHLSAVRHPQRADRRRRARMGRRGPRNFEFQRLHGMGEGAVRRLVRRRSGYQCRIYAPVGGHRDLLAYLVRRLLENGANSSFVRLPAGRRQCRQRSR